MEAVHDLARQGRGLVTSLGLQTWELSLWAAGEASLPVIVVLPETEVDENTIEAVAHDFGLDPERVSLHVFPITTQGRSAKRAWSVRDQTAFELADEILPISVRPSGNLHRLMQEAHVRGATVNDSFCVPYPRIKRPPVAQRLSTEELASWASDPAWPYLTHWTRTVPGPWPGESPLHYYRDLAAPDETTAAREYPRSACQTLQRIIHERTLRGTTFRIRGSHSIVAFTAQNPADALTRMRYRGRFQRWNFEPYGLAIRRECLETLGARPVHYAGQTPTPSSDIHEAFIQGGNDERVDWSLEAEWRLLGSCSLSALDPEDILVFVKNPKEATLLEQTSPWPVRALLRDDTGGE